MTHHASAQDQVQRFYDTEADSYDASRYETQRGRRRDQFHKNLVLELLKTGSSDPTARSPVRWGARVGNRLRNWSPVRGCCPKRGSKLQVSICQQGC